MNKIIFVISCTLVFICSAQTDTKFVGTYYVLSDKKEDPYPYVRYDFLYDSIVLILNSDHSFEYKIYKYYSEKEEPILDSCQMTYGDFYIINDSLYLNSSKRDVHKFEDGNDRGCVFFSSKSPAFAKFEQNEKLVRIRTINIKVSYYHKNGYITRVPRKKQIFWIFHKLNN